MYRKSSKKAFEPMVLEEVLFAGDVITSSGYSGEGDNGDSPIIGEELPIDIYSARKEI